MSDSQSFDVSNDEMRRVVSDLTSDNNGYV